MPAVGSPDGHGRYGILDEDGERAMCHECGRWYAALGTHVATAHHMSAQAYKLRHGLPLSRGLLARDALVRRKDRAVAAVNGPGWAAFEQARDPHSAHQARDAGTWQALSQAGRRDPDTATTNLPRRAVKVVSCVVCGATYCQLPGAGHPRATCSPACLEARQDAGREASNGGRSAANAERDALIRAAVAAGTSVPVVASAWGITPTRVRQIVRRQAT